MSTLEPRFTNIPPMPNFHTPSLVMFYADWCGHCVRFKPTFVKSVPDVPKYRVDASDPGTNSAAHELCQRYQITKFPTVMYFDKDLPHGHVTFTGERTEDGIRSFVTYLRTHPQATQEEVNNYA